MMLPKFIVSPEDFQCKLGPPLVADVLHFVRLRPKLVHQFQLLIGSLQSLEDIRARVSDFQNGLDELYIALRRLKFKS